MNNETQQFVDNEDFDRLFNALHSTHKPRKAVLEDGKLAALGLAIVKFQRLESTPGDAVARGLCRRLAKGIMARRPGSSVSGGLAGLIVGAESTRRRPVEQNVSKRMSDHPVAAQHRRFCESVEWSGRVVSAESSVPPTIPKWGLRRGRRPSSLALPVSMAFGQDGRHTNCFPGALPRRR